MAKHQLLAKINRMLGPSPPAAPRVAGAAS
jgi:hypothetical protein